jgi:hypothetical protein
MNRKERRAPLRDEQVITVLVPNNPKIEATAARNILDDNAAILEALRVAGMRDADFNSVFGLVAEWSDSELAGARDSAFPPLY